MHTISKVLVGGCRSALELAPLAGTLVHSGAIKAAQMRRPDDLSRLSGRWAVLKFCARTPISTFVSRKRAS